MAYGTSKKGRIKFVQHYLNERGQNAGTEDGIMGPKTLAALEAVDGISEKWSKQRKVIAFIQLLAEENEIEAGPIDGYWGPQTSHAYESLIHFFEQESLPEVWRPEDAADTNPNEWPVQTTEDLNDFYGEVGERQAKIDLPYPHRLSWNRSRKVNRFSCHEKVHDSLLKVLTNVHDHYGMERIKELRLDIWGGCLNVRKMRGGSSYSSHSWGIALDYDPERNRLKWGMDRAAFAKPEYAKWWEFWEAEGWISLGRTRNFDWMHIQAARNR